jgi:hypothetical protein
MKKQLIAVAIASALALAGGVLAADKEMEAVVTVTKFDPATRTVQIQTKSRQAELQLGPNIDVSNVQEGNRYQLSWVQATATSVEPGAQAGAGATGSAEKAGSGAVITNKRAGIIEKVDAANKEFTLRTTKGDSETFTMGQGVSAESLKTGEAVTVAYQRPVVSQLRSSPQPVSDPAPPQ